MASFAEMIYGKASESVGHAGEGVVQAGIQGAQLAIQQEELNNKKRALDLDKEKVEQAKWEKVGTMYETYNKLPDGPGKKAFGEKYIPSAFKVMGIDQAMNPAVVDQMSRDPEVGAFMVSRVAQGRLSQADIANNAKDPLKFNKMLAEQGYSTWVDEKLIKGTSEAYAQDIGKAEDKALTRKTQLEASVKRGDAFQDRNVIGVIKDATNAVTTGNKVIKDLVVSSNNLSNAITSYYEGGAKKQDYFELQQAVRSNLGIKGNSTGVERAETIAKDWKVDVADVIQFLTGDPQSTMKASPKLAAAVIAQARKEMENKFGQAKAEQDTQMQKNNAYFEMYPQIKPHIEMARDKLQEQFTQPHVPDNVDTVQFDGRIWTRKALQDVIDKNPNHPKSVEARKILGGKK